MADSHDVLSRLEEPAVSGHLLSKLKHAQAASRAALEGEFGRIGITIPQFLALASIDETTDISSAELARRSYCLAASDDHHRRTARSRRARSRAPPPRAVAARSRCGSPTRARDLLKSARAHAYAIERFVLDTLGASAYAQLLDTLERFTEALSQGTTVTKTAPWDAYLGEAPAMRDRPR